MSPEDYKTNPYEIVGNRRGSIQDLESQIYDVAIIGAGINGAGVARELALRGLKVALVDKGDFGGATSSASSKLVHGGLRYLEQGRFGLVAEALRERKYLLQNAPHLTSLQPFVFPVYATSRVSFWKLKLGMLFYQGLASFYQLKPFKILSKEGVLEKEPFLDPEGLVGGVLYYDGKMDDARVTLETVLQARQFGADIWNYMRVTDADVDGKRVKALRVKDCLTGQEGLLKAKTYLNTAGPWIDEVVPFFKTESKPLIRPSKGAHILTRSFTEHAVVLESPRDGRVLFVIPWGEYSLVGTTDTDYSASLDDIYPNEDDSVYLQEAVLKMFPHVTLGTQDIVAAFSGIRPLVSDKAGKGVGSISREERIFMHGENCWTLAGGKYTTYRHMTERMAKKILKKLQQKRFKSLTKRLPLYGGDIGNTEKYIRKNFPLESRIYDISKEKYTQLVNRYGSAYQNVLSVIFEDADYRSNLPGSTVLKGEVIYSIRHEWTCTITDFMRRRVGLFFQEGQGVDCLDEVAHLFAKEFGWHALEIEVAKKDYLTFLDHHKPFS